VSKPNNLKRYRRWTVWLPDGRQIVNVYRDDDYNTFVYYNKNWIEVYYAPEYREYELRG
jgi:hypothetical protein